MNKHYKRVLLGMAVTSALGLGVMGSAHADAYAYSYANYTNGYVTITGNVTGVTSVDTSAASATMNGSGTSTSATGGGTTSNPLPDATPNCLGSAAGCSNNSFAPIGMNGTNYSKGDSVVSSDAFHPPGYIDATNVAESNVVGNNNAHGEGDTSSASKITFQVGGAGATVDLAFDATPFLDAKVVGELSAEASMSFTVTITDANNNIVFLWQPNGQLGPIFGGTEVSDMASLNVDLTQLDAGEKTYNPSCLDGAGASILCHYEAITNTLSTPGTYTLSLATNNITNASSVVPEPETLALLGLGLTGIGWVGRRGKKKAA